MFKFKSLFYFLPVCFGIIFILSLSSASVFAAPKTGRTPLVYAVIDSAFSLSSGKNPKLVLSETKIKNYRYYLSFEQRFVQLKNGYYKSGSNPDDYISARLENYAIGDLNKDGNDDVAVILSSQGMGSGTFYEITALVLKDRNISQTNLIVIGDRIRIKHLSIESGEIILDVVTHKPNDPAYRPSQEFIQRFRLNGKKLGEIKND